MTAQQEVATQAYYNVTLLHHWHSIAKEKDAAKCRTKELKSVSAIGHSLPYYKSPPPPSSRGLPIGKDTVKHRTKLLTSDQLWLTPHSINTSSNMPVKQDHCGC